MSGKMWKAKVNHLGASIDRCRERIDEVVQEEKSTKMSKLAEQYREQVYNNGSGTTVEVSIKTKKPSRRSIDAKRTTSKSMVGNNQDKNWDTLLSQDDDQSDMLSPPNVKRTQSLTGKPFIKESMVPKRTMPPKRIKSTRLLSQKSTKAPVDFKQFAQKTKSSRAKEKDENMPNLQDEVKLNKLKSLGESERIQRTENRLGKENFVGFNSQNQNNFNENAKHEFPNRTLQIFLRELRSAVNSSYQSLSSSSNSLDLNKIIDDIEFVAANLSPNLAGTSTLESPNVTAPQTKHNRIPRTSNAQTAPLLETMVPNQLIQEQIVRRLQLELEKVHTYYISFQI